MCYYTEKNKIVITDTEDFDAKKILECGQVFRFKKICDDFEIFAGNQRAVLKPMQNRVEIECTDESFFVNYFDLSKNYDIIRLNLKDKGLIGAAVDFGQGIRILRQNPFETLISFIISANNHIPRIKAIIERLCTALGEKRDGYYAFPSADALASKDADFYIQNGLGYRAPYIVNTAKAVVNGFDLNKINSMTSADAQKYLCTLSGVGPKVADCILLFGYGRSDVFPVDTWIKKVYNCYFGSENNPKIIREALVDRFGDLSGYAQQYLFYYKRELD